MNNFTAIVFVLGMLMFAGSMALGVDLKDWFGWIQVASSFLMGFLMGHNIAERLIFAIFFAAMTMWIGPIVWKRRNR